tara:strand:+ start:1421 stop:1747 length:327 start_codon:yes stop_codon:yes gene_type:complete
MTAIIQFQNIGVDADNFLIYSNVDNYTSAFETNVSRQSLINGFVSDQVPNGTTIIKVLSTTDKCKNEIFINLEIPTTTTTSTTIIVGSFLLLETSDPIEQENNNFIEL